VRWALARVAVAVTSMVAVAFLIPLGIAVNHIAAQRAYTDAQTRVAAIEPLLAVTTDRAQLQRALATMAGPQNVALRLPDGTEIGPGHVTRHQLDLAAAQGRTSTLAVPGGSVLVQPELLDGGDLTLIEVYIDAGQTRHGVLSAWLILIGVAFVLVIGSTLVADRLGDAGPRQVRRGERRRRSWWTTRARA
jgi:hypothetical protein